MTQDTLTHKILTLARDSINYYLINKSILKPLKEKYNEDIFLQKSGVFVTLKIANKLRGCIGYIESDNTILNNIIECSVSSAFFDPRFEPVNSTELENLNISVSILTKPEEYVYKDNEELIKYLSENKPGVVLEYGIYKATYLPEVWEDLKDPEEFLSSLCMKAGLDKNFWKNNKISIFIYYSEIYSQ